MFLDALKVSTDGTTAKGAAGVLLAFTDPDRISTLPELATLKGSTKDNVELELPALATYINQRQSDTQRLRINILSYLYKDLMVAVTFGNTPVHHTAVGWQCAGKIIFPLA